jgi:uncharacterized repeat protein (TIGR01451 family)
MNTFVKSLTAMALILSSISAWSEVELKNEAFKVVTLTSDNGASSEQWQTPDKMLPGDKVGYQISFENTGKEAATDIVIANPIPENTVYVAASAKGLNTDIDFSTDGGKTYAQPSKLLIEKDGERVQATAADYTHVRWTLNKPLAIGAESSVQYAVIIK